MNNKLKPEPIPPALSDQINSIDVAFKPTSLIERVNSLDVIRGIAVLGILLLNITGFGLAYSNDNPTISGGADGWNYKVWAINDVLFEGTMRGLFTMLFGVGFMLFTSRGLQKGAGIAIADFYYRRILWLLFFGLIHSYVLLWHGDILFTYAICGLMLFAFRKTKPKYLLIFGIFILITGSLRFVMNHQKDLEIKKEGIAAETLLRNNVKLSEEQTISLEKWKEIMTKTKKVSNENEALQKGYLSIMKYRYSRSRNNQTVNLYNYNLWDSLGFMLIGMAFFSWGIFHAKRSNKFYFIMLITGYVIGLSINFYELHLVSSSNFDVIAISKAKLTYHAGRLFTTLGHIGLFMLFIKSGILRFFQNALASVGKMAFTNYIIHTLICNFVFMGFGFGLFGKLQRYELYYVVIAIWIIQLIYSPIWFRYFKYGPLEWMWRSLTYSKIQSFRK